MDELEIRVTASNSRLGNLQNLTFNLCIPGVMNITVLVENVPTENEFFRTSFQRLIDGEQPIVFNEQTQEFERLKFSRLISPMELNDYDDTIQLKPGITVSRKLLAPHLADALGLRPPACSGDNIKG